MVLTQYKSHSLDRHITTTWRMSTLLGNYITPVPAQQRLGPQWFRGSADAIHQSLNLVYDDEPDHVVVFGADHVYRMDPRQMVEQHIASGAGVTVAGIRVPRKEAWEFGVIQTSDGRAIDAFLEKPADPPGLPDDPDTTYASMGNYVFTTEALLEAVKADALDESSKHDMGGNIIPMLVAQGRAQVYDFRDNDVPGSTERDRGLLARRGDARQLLRRAHGPDLGAPGVQPLQPALADPHQRRRRTPRPSSSSTSPAGWARRSTAWSARA